MSRIDLTAEGVFDSLTGFDEIAIAQQFGRTVVDLAESDKTMFGRALAFIVKRRDGASDTDAKDAAFQMTLKDLNENFFAEATEDESGKDEPPEEQPTTSLTSVS